MLKSGLSSQSVGIPEAESDLAAGVDLDAPEKFGSEEEDAELDLYRWKLPFPIDV